MIYLLTGPVHSGKTTLLKEAVPLLRAAGVPYHGYLSEAVWKEGEPFGYDLLDLKEGSSCPFIRREGRDHWQQVGRYFFLPDGLSKAEEIIRNSREADLLIVDEVGPLELKGQGVWPVLQEILPLQQCLLVVREAKKEEVFKKLSPLEVKEFHIRNKDAISRIIENVTLKEP